jgi:hypothetical protein
VTANAISTVRLAKKIRFFANIFCSSNQQPDLL